MIKCVDKQLVDFFPDGKFYTADTEDNLKRTKFARHKFGM